MKPGRIRPGLQGHRTRRDGQDSGSGVVEKGASSFYLGYQSEDGEEPMLDTSPDALAFATRLPFLRG